MSASDQGEGANEKTKELQPIKHDCFRGQQEDKTHFSPEALYRPPEGMERRRGGSGGLQRRSEHKLLKLTANA